MNLHHKTGPSLPFGNLLLHITSHAFICLKEKWVIKPRGMSQKLLATSRFVMPGWVVEMPLYISHGFFMPTNKIWSINLAPKPFWTCNVTWKVSKTFHSARKPGQDFAVLQKLDWAPAQHLLANGLLIALINSTKRRDLQFVNEAKI